MRNHPDFESELLPHITDTLRKLSAAKSSVEILTNHSFPFLEDKRG
jgi:hypothetical protein